MLPSCRRLILGESKTVWSRYQLYEGVPRMLCLNLMSLRCLMSLPNCPRFMFILSVTAVALWPVPAIYNTLLSKQICFKCCATIENGQLLLCNTASIADIMIQYTMGKLKNGVKSSQLWPIISLAILIPKFQNFAHSSLNFPITQINTNIENKYLKN